jgi:hypothetical protein
MPKIDFAGCIVVASQPSYRYFLNFDTDFLPAHSPMDVEQPILIVL